MAFKATRSLPAQGVSPLRSACSAEREPRKMLLRPERALRAWQGGAAPTLSPAQRRWRPALGGTSPREWQQPSGAAPVPQPGRHILTWHRGQRGPAAHLGPSSEQPGGAWAGFSCPVSSFQAPCLNSRFTGKEKPFLSAEAGFPGTGKHPLPSARFGGAQAARSGAPCSSSTPRLVAVPASPARWVSLVGPAQQGCCGDPHLWSEDFPQRLGWDTQPRVNC